MLSDRKHSYDTFWFTLFHEIGHIVNKDYGISFEDGIGEEELKANKYAEESLIPNDYYQEFIKNNDITYYSVVEFSNSINRDSSIVVGRLEKDKYINYGDPRFKSLKRKCRL